MAHSASGGLAGNGNTPLNVVLLAGGGRSKCSLPSFPGQRVRRDAAFLSDTARRLTGKPASALVNEAARAAVASARMAAAALEVDPMTALALTSAAGRQAEVSLLAQDMAASAVGVGQ